MTALVFGIIITSRQMPLHNQTTLMLESALMERRNVALVTIPYLIDS